MNTLKKILVLFTLAMGMALPLIGFAQSLTDGEVKKVDLEAGKVTIKHGEIKHLDMPSMAAASAVPKFATKPRRWLRAAALSGGNSAQPASLKATNQATST